MSLPIIRGSNYCLLSSSETPACCSTAALNLPPRGFHSIGSFLRDRASRQPLLGDPRDTERALFIEFGHGRVDFQGLSQMTMLAPGTYKLQGKYRGEISGRRGL